MSNLIVPNEFKKACINLGQNIGYEQPGLDVIAMYAASGLDGHDVTVIKRFLDDELLSGRHSVEKLMEIWWSTPASIYFHDGRQLLEFLRLFRELLDKSS